MHAAVPHAGPYATDAIAIIDADNTVQYANPALERVLGYAPETLEEEPLTTLVPERFRDRHRAAFERYRETGQRRLDWEAVRFPGRHADGHEVPLEVSFAEFEAGGERGYLDTASLDDEPTAVAANTRAADRPGATDGPAAGVVARGRACAGLRVLSRAPTGLRRLAVRRADRLRRPPEPVRRDRTGRARRTGRQHRPVRQRRREQESPGERPRGRTGVHDAKRGRVVRRARDRHRGDLRVRQRRSTDGRLRAFFLVRGAVPADVRAFLDQSVAVEDCRLVVELSSDADVREFVETLEVLRTAHRKPLDLLLAERPET